MTIIGYTHQIIFWNRTGVDWEVEDYHVICGRVIKVMCLNGSMNTEIVLNKLIKQLVKLFDIA